MIIPSGIVDSPLGGGYNQRMRVALKGCGLAVAVFAAAVLALFASTAQSVRAQESWLGDPLDRAITHSARYFECNGTYQERFDTWWLSTANPFKFRRYFTGTWYFDDMQVSSIEGLDFILRLDFDVYTNSRESGGKPTAASVDLIVQNPNSEEELEILNVRVEMNKDEIPMPTYVYVPKRMLTDDGRVVVEVHGLGQIGIGRSRLRLLAPLERY